MLVKTAIGIAAALGMGATPALAKEGMASAATQIASSIDQAEAGPAAASDEEFGALFASWEALDDGGRITSSGEIAPAPRNSVSVPSRMPVEGVRLTSGYGMRNHPILRQRRQHNGVDLAAGHGTPVYATADGRVGRAQWFGSYGNYVQIEHGGDLQTRYAHLSSYTVAAGERVQKGDLIGYIGSTGRSTGPHLHYEVRLDGEPVDPIPYMTAQYADLDHGEGAVGGPE
ncbi:M23 family metallopeptidase [Alteraurantiacibacter aquimixticola]|uniref:M23 family metallopeptidase n=1 Tax=Alteraurantiacibacter aquimixticola TaxID=2489173 RepID=A0A4T3F311_9SPHN|nr:M23 family metallopeptidase [Alteraurantiacibacter aquimixticola]TIX49000.1 M23 family metallopeptidase [Alteraurantiacibacter aquimixticola]